jgi:hypothetical protein
VEVTGQRVLLGTEVLAELVEGAVDFETDGNGVALGVDERQRDVGDGVVGLRDGLLELLVLAEAPVGAGRGVRVAEHVRAERGRGAGPLRTAEREDLLVRAAEFLPVGDLALVDLPQLLDGDLLHARLEDLAAHRDGLAVDADDVVDELVQRLIGGVREFVRRRGAGVTDVDAAVLDALDPRPGVRQRDVRDERRVRPLARRLVAVEAGPVVGEAFVRVVLAAGPVARPVVLVARFRVGVPVARAGVRDREHGRRAVARQRSRVAVSTVSTASRPRSAGTPCDAGHAGRRRCLYEPTP